MPGDFLGVGTKYYGQRDFQTDGSYLTTLWIVVLYFPLFPIWSYRIKDRGSKGRVSFRGNYIDRYEVLEREPISLKQWVSVWGYIIGFVILIETAFGPFRYPAGPMRGYMWGFIATIVRVVLAALSPLRIPLPAKWMGVSLLGLWVVLPSALRWFAVRRVRHVESAQDLPRSNESL